LRKKGLKEIISIIYIQGGIYTMAEIEYESREVKEITFRNNKRRLELEAKRADGETISVTQIEDLMNVIAEEYGYDLDHIGVAALNEERLITLKGYGDDRFADYWQDEYLSNKAVDIKQQLSKFHTVYFFITL